MSQSSNKFKVKKGDKVVVLSGKDRGKTGVVEQVLREKSRVIVEGVNIVKRHTKARPPANPQQASRNQQTGGVIEKAAAIHVSNVAVVSPASGKPTRVGFRFEDGRKVRVARRDSVDLDETKKTK
ncbi:MAG: 50S ribosomal protein L24 [Thermoleophilia bacterium]|nr:50S ribosomal protein L24 [Thermoleophilia bacterium]